MELIITKDWDFFLLPANATSSKTRFRESALYEVGRQLGHLVFGRLLSLGLWAGAAALAAPSGRTTPSDVPPPGHDGVVLFHLGRFNESVSAVI
jgi:hypothetical protein